MVPPPEFFSVPLKLSRGSLVARIDIIAELYLFVLYPCHIGGILRDTFPEFEFALHPGTSKIIVKTSNNIIVLAVGLPPN